jgi:hypothetical protein
MIIWLRSDLLATGVFLKGLCVLKCILCCDPIRCSDYSHRYKSVIAANCKFIRLLLVLKQVLLKRLYVIKKIRRLRVLPASSSLCGRQRFSACFVLWARNYKSDLPQSELQYGLRWLELDLSLGKLFRRPSQCLKCGVRSPQNLRRVSNSNHTPRLAQSKVRLFFMFWDYICPFL